jgi:hypothetical protein
VPKIIISLEGEGENLHILDVAREGVEKLDQAAEQASKGGLASLVKGAADLKAGFDVLSSNADKALRMIGDVNDMGVASLRAQAGFTALGGTKQSIDSMSASVKGLVDNTDLLRQGTFAMATGAVKDQGQLSELARIGATLGLTFRGSAREGIDAFTEALEHVGQKRSLMTLGIDAQEVDRQFKMLRGTMSDEQAWNLSIFDVAGVQADKLSGALTGTGTALERLKIGAQDWAETQAEHVAQGIEGLIGLVDVLTNRQKYLTEGVLAANAALINQGDIIVKYHGQDYKTFLPDMPGSKPGQPVYGPPAPPTPPVTFGAVTGPQYTAQTWAIVDEGYDRHLANIHAELDIWKQIGQLKAQQHQTDQDADRAYEAAMWAKVKAGQMQANVSGFDPMWAFVRPGQMQATADATTELYKQSQGWNSVAGFVTKVVEGTVQLGDVIQKNTEKLNRQKEVMGGQVGDMDQAIQDRRSALERRGVGAGNLAQYDQDSTEAMNAYRVAAGLATQADIAMERAKQGLHDQYVKGKISLDQYIKGMSDLGGAFLKDKDNAAALYGVLLDIQHWKPPSKQDTKGLQDMFDESGLTPGGGGQAGAGKRFRGQADTPIDPLNTALETAKTKTREVGTDLKKLSTDANVYGKAAATGLTPLHNGLDIGLQKTQVLNKELAKFGGLKATIRIGVEWGSGGGGELGHRGG